MSLPSFRTESAGSEWLRAGKAGSAAEEWRTFEFAAADCSIEIISSYSLEKWVGNRRRIVLF